MIGKFSVTADQEVIDEARRRVAAGAAPNFSAYVQQALANENMAQELTLDDFLDELDREYGPPGPEADAWARRVLGI
jgi:hypothetical protein